MDGRTLWERWVRFQTGGAGHGRVETRRIAVSTEAVAYLEWPGLAQIARLQRTREVRGRESVETVYLITSLPPGDAGPERLLDLARAHWPSKTASTTSGM